MKHNKKGFTLVELLVVISIISIISGVMVVNFRTSEQTNKLQRSAQQVVQGLRKAQGMALFSTEVPGKCSQNICEYYGVYFNKQSMNSYYYIFVSENKTYASGEDIETVNLENGIIIDSLSTGTQLNVVFSPPHAFVEFNPTTTQATITVKKEDGTCPQDCRYIKIDNKGWMAVKRTP